jgi:hypothetical protein
MHVEEITQLTRILQLSITPVALISGVGLLLLSMTNRLGRVIDRSRDTHALMRSAGPGEIAPTTELELLLRRARLLLSAIALVITSMFLAVLMVVALFAMHFFASSLYTIILLLFGLCLACLVTATACFLGDVILSIRWLRVSLGHRITQSTPDPLQ